MVINNPLIRPAISWGGGIGGGVPLDSHDKTKKADSLEWCDGELQAFLYRNHFLHKCPPLRQPTGFLIDIKYSR